MRSLGWLAVYVLSIRLFPTKGLWPCLEGLKRGLALRMAKWGIACISCAESVDAEAAMTGLTVTRHVRPIYCNGVTHQVGWLRGSWVFAPGMPGLTTSADA